MEAIITAATVLALYLNVATSNTNGYIYNAVYEDNQVAKIEVFSQDGKSLSRKLQYHYSYDAQGRLASKEPLRWNALAAECQPSQLFVYEYTGNGYTLSLSNCFFALLLDCYTAAMATPCRSATGAMRQASICRRTRRWSIIWWQTTCWRWTHTGAMTLTRRLNVRRACW